MKTTAIIEARMTSSRLPGKVMMETCGKPMLQHMIERVKRCGRIDDVIVATTVNSEDDDVCRMCDDMGFHYFRGSEEDVLLRVLEAARQYDVDVIVELTGDCPLIDHRHIDHLLEIYESGKYDFVSNCTERTFPDGFDIRIFSTKMLEDLSEISKDPADREHVAIYFPRHPEKYRNYNWKAEGSVNRPDIEVTLDEIGDYKLIDRIYSKLYPENPDFSCEDVINLLNQNPDFLDLIKEIKRKTV